MNNRIHLMPPLLANQIAAGEVVERPASIVKELLENSLDAGAKTIQIDLDGGGMDLIKIRDDGCGIDKEDLVLALSRHATSKIRSIDDLQNINSLGFRGEALASIAAVTRLSLTSRPMGSEHAWKVNSDDSAQNFTLEPAAHPQGTTLEARNLFYNTPARRKFLRSEKTELGHIENVIKQMALSQHDVQITLRHKQSVLLHARGVNSATASATRIAAICGQPFINNALKIESDDGIVNLQGWLGTADAARSQNDLQYFYVNGRIVKDKLINHAIRMAYQDYLYEGKHPAYVLYLTLPHNQVDVNVHPTKHEVRFYESRQVHDFIVFHLQRTLSGVLPAMTLETVTTSEPLAQSSSVHSHPIYHSKPTNLWTQLAVHETEAPYISGVVNPTITSLATDVKTSSLGRVLGLLQQQYLLLESADGLAFIHIQRAKQAIAYQHLLNASAELPLVSQPLLLPTSMSLSSVMSEQVEQNIEQLTPFGIKLARMAQERWVVRELPAVLKHANIERALIELCKHSTEWSSDVLCKTLSKYADERVEFILSDKEQTELISDLSRLPDLAKHWLKPYRWVSLDEVERLF